MPAPWEDLEELLNAAENGTKGDDPDDADSDLDETDDGSDADEKESLPKALAAKLAQMEANYAKLEERREEDRYLFLTQIASLRGANPKPEVKEEAPPEITDDDLIEAMKQHPELAPQIMARMVDSKVGALEGKLEARIMGKLTSEKAGSKIDQILAHYAEDMNPKSPIYTQAVEMKETLAPFLDQAVRGSNMHDRLAFLLAAANNPGQVAERFTARNEALDKRRDGMRDRLAGLLGGDSAGGGNTGPKITADEIEIGERLGIDLKDKKVRARFLETKQRSAGMGVLAAGEFLGRKK